jgi:rfaE bifunctional protein nucleotidyltransferase chain/domain
VPSKIAKARRFDRQPRAVAPCEKLRTLQEVAAFSLKMRMAGKKVVQAHGAIDLLHLGHVRHLEAARRLGDALVVTVTADRFVNKGPGRPVFTEGMRAEMLAALEFVDWVAISESPDAVAAIECIRPAVYVKGQDYRNAETDVTGKITLERKAAEAHGGRLQFTDEATFSSSTLINRHLPVFEPHVRDYLDGLRRADALAGILELIDQIKSYRVLIVGDAIIDEYQYVLPMAKASKENVIATRYQNREVFAGGVFAAANHVASYCAEVDIVTCLGAAESYESFILEKLRPNVRLNAITRPGAPTTLKQRFVDPSQMRKLFEVYFIEDEPLATGLQAELDTTIAQMTKDYDVVIVTDFGHGLIAPSTIEELIASARFLAVNTQSNSGNLGYNLISKYAKADYVCIDAPEARLAAHDRFSNIADIADRLSREHVDCSKIVITHGRNGCITFERGGAVHTIPAFGKNVVDTIGAGDAFLAITAPLVAAGGSMHHIGFIGNVVGALMIEIVGHRQSVEKSSLIKAITGLLK